jgi:antitoxin HicB
MKYIYPAIFKQEENGYSVVFPDIHNAFTSGETLPEAMEMAQDVLCLMLYEAEESGTPIPEASSIQSIATKADEFTSLIACDTLEYRKFYDNKAVKKTLTIPAWLNTMAERNGINFSATLQAALKNELHL